MTAELRRADGATLKFEGSAEEFEKVCAAFSPPPWNFTSTPSPFNPTPPLPGTWCGTLGTAGGPSAGVTYAVPGPHCS